MCVFQIMPNSVLQDSRYEVFHNQKIFVCLIRQLVFIMNIIIYFDSLWVDQLAIA